MLNVETVLWDLPWSEYRLWRASNLGDFTFAEYHARLDQDVARAYAEGRPVTLLRASVADVLRAMRDLGLPETAESLPHALLSLYGCETHSSAQRRRPPPQPGPRRHDSARGTV
jgi:hypothetical protein